MKEKLLKYKEYFYTKFWKDPVWSNVIAAGILLLFGYFVEIIEINRFIFWIAILLLLFTIYKFLSSFIPTIIYKIKSSKIESNNEPKQIEPIYYNSNEFFSERLAKAFPGQRGLVWYEPKEAVKRLKIMLQEPLVFKSNETYPIWWFRDICSSSIDNFKSLSKTKVLINEKEFEIKRIGVYVSKACYKSFIYVETKGEKQTGLNNFKPEYIKDIVDKNGYIKEEYGLFGKVKISRDQYDDRATIINNKIVDASNAELRVRFLSDYNFIITYYTSPYNSRKFEDDSEEYFNNILKSNIDPQVFFDYLDTYKKPIRINF